MLMLKLMQSSCKRNIGQPMHLKSLPSLQMLKLKLVSRLMLSLRLSLNMPRFAWHQMERLNQMLKKS